MAHGGNETCLLKTPIALSQKQKMDCSTYCERLSLASTCNKAKALGLNCYSSALDVLFHVPEQ